MEREKLSILYKKESPFAWVINISYTKIIKDSLINFLHGEHGKFINIPKFSIRDNWLLRVP